jgi:hypothetical protein
MMKIDIKSFNEVLSLYNVKSLPKEYNAVYLTIINTEIGSGVAVRFFMQYNEYSKRLRFLHHIVVRGVCI